MSNDWLSVIGTTAWRFLSLDDAKSLFRRRNLYQLLGKLK
jgi:hypothetical protein